jgi:zinc transporter, ZIP family
MSVWVAIAWGTFTSASLYLGEWLSRPLQGRLRLTGVIMGFGAGTLLSAVAYELIPEASFRHGAGIGIAFAIGAVAYYVGDRLVDRRGGGDRQDVDASGDSGSGAAMFVGALLDGIPEAYILGISLARGTGVSIAFVVAVFVSNIPQGVAGTTALKAAGYTERRVATMWASLTLACAAASAGGYLLAHQVHVEGLYSEAFAAGAVLTMLADSMMPEAFEHGGKVVGLVTVLGYLIAGGLAVAQ